MEITRLTQRGASWQTAARTSGRYSARLSAHFNEVLANHEAMRPEWLAPHLGQDPEDWIDASTALANLRMAIEVTGDQALGLRAALTTKPGDYDVLEYVVGSCKTVADSLEAVGRYIGLINSNARYELEHADSGAVMRFGEIVPVPRASIDFQIGSVYYGFFPRINMGSGVKVCFRYPQPADIDLYAEVFPGAELHFGAAFDGFVLSDEHLQTPLPKCDPTLNEMLRRYGDQLLDLQRNDDRFAERIRKLVVDGLPSGMVSADSIAKQVGMTRRTLLRHLEQEHTTFKDLLEATRRQLAAEYLRGGELNSTEVALLLGFSQPSTFHRAFKRWTGKTPLEYRRQVRGPGGERQLAAVL